MKPKEYPYCGACGKEIRWEDDYIYKDRTMVCNNCSDKKIPKPKKKKEDPKLIKELLSQYKVEIGIAVIAMLTIYGLISLLGDLAGWLT